MAPLDTRTSHPEQRYHVWESERGHTLMPEHSADHVITTAGRHVTVTARRESVAAKVAVRVVRQLIMRAGEGRGGRCIHAGIVDLRGQGVLVAGRAGAGKTTVLTHLVEHHGGRPVANDRTVLVPSPFDTWQAVGVPLAWRFTPEGVGGSARLRAGLAEFEPSRGRELIDGKLELTPGEVARLLGSTPAPAARATRLVIVTRGSVGPSARPDHTSVRDHLDFGDGDFFAEDWLGIRAMLDAPGPVAPDGGWSELAATLPIQVLSWTEPSELSGVASAAALGARP